MTDLSSLIERIEKSEGADREIDARIQCWLHGVRYQYHFQPHVGDGTQIEFTRPPKRSREVSKDGNPPAPLVPHAPRYTDSVDAALTLVPRDHYWALNMMGERTGYNACCVKAGQLEWSEAATPALAICAAALKARSQSHDNQKENG